MNTAVMSVENTVAEITDKIKKSSRIFDGFFVVYAFYTLIKLWFCAFIQK